MKLQRYNIFGQDFDLESHPIGDFVPYEDIENNVNLMISEIHRCFDNTNEGIDPDLVIYMLNIMIGKECSFTPVKDYSKGLSKKLLDKPL